MRLRHAVLASLPVLAFAAHGQNLVFSSAEPATVSDQTAFSVYSFLHCADPNSDIYLSHNDVFEHYFTTGVSNYATWDSQVYDGAISAGCFVEDCGQEAVSAGGVYSNGYRIAIGLNTIAIRVFANGGFSAGINSPLRYSSETPDGTSAVGGTRMGVGIPFVVGNAGVLKIVRARLSVNCSCAVPVGPTQTVTYAVAGSVCSDGLGGTLTRNDSCSAASHSGASSTSICAEAETAIFIDYQVGMGTGASRCLIVPCSSSCQYDRCMFAAPRFDMVVRYDDNTACLGDIDGDNDVDINDLARLLNAYETTIDSESYDADADLNGDLAVNLTDLSTLLSRYGTTCQ